MSIIKCFDELTMYSPNESVISSHDDDHPWPVHFVPWSFRTIVMSSHSEKSFYPKDISSHSHFIPLSVDMLMFTISHLFKY